MKANEAPEKIYLHIRANNEIGSTWHGDKITNKDVEYTRTDAFIEKACEWLKENITNNRDCNRIMSRNGVVTMGMIIDGFKNYMKGE